MKTDKKDSVVDVVREGKQIIIPEGMAYKTAREWLTRKEEAEEQMVNINESVVCYPLDGLVALKRAAEKIYGFYKSESRGFWGNILPTQMAPVKLWGGETVPVPYAALVIPTWEGGQIQPIIQPEMKLGLRATVKKKFEVEVRELFEEVKEQLKTNSIYKGKAVSVNLSFLESEDEEFHPENDAPKFMEDVVDTNEDQIILNDVTKFEVATNLYSLIERTDAMKRNHIPLKHGAVLAGTYGTGKTFLGKIIAGKAVKNGWTFIYLEKVEQIATALKFAQTYSPAVIFAEDVDQVTSGGRDSSMNNILNTIDGIDTKGKAIITILTTNNVEKIEPGFLRAGRVDSLIVIEKPDEFSAQKFVRLYAGETLADDVDLPSVGKELAGMSAAFITEVVQKAKRHAIYHTGDNDITGKVTTNDLILAAQAMAKHIKLAEQRLEKTPAEQIAQALRVVGAAQSPVLPVPDHVWNMTNGNYAHRIGNALASIKS